MNDAVWLAIMVAALFVIAIGLDRASKAYATSHAQPELTPADEAPAFKDETSALPIVTPEEVPSMRTGALAHVRREKVCPVCGHVKGREGCRRRIGTQSGRKLSCGCSNPFHDRKRAASKSKAKPKKTRPTKRVARKARG